MNKDYRKHYFSLWFSDGLNVTNVSSSDVKQDERNPLFFCQKPLLILLRKTLERASFGKEEDIPPPSAFFRYNDSGILKLPNFLIFS